MYAIPNCHLKTICSEEYNISDVHDSPIFLNVHKFRGTNNEMNLNTSNLESENQVHKMQCSMQYHVIFMTIRYCTAFNSYSLFLLVTFVSHVAYKT